MTSYDDVMSKRLAVTLSDYTHEQVAERAAEAGVSMHAWIVAAIEREAYRQLLEKAKQWWKDHPEQVAKDKAAYEEEERWRAQRAEQRGSSAA